MSFVAEKTTPKDYAAAKQGFAYYLVSNPGYLEIGGETRQDYLQRQTTNDLGLLSPTRALPNLLTSASGRILEVFTLIHDGDAIGMLTQAGHGPGLADYFKKRIFFNDKVSLSDKSEDFALLELYGPQAETAIRSLGFEHMPAMDEVAETNLEGQRLRAIGTEGNSQAKLIFSKSVLDQLTNQLGNAGAKPLSFESRERLRVEAIQPGDPEFNGEYTPFELGLDRYVSTEKGCYTGQEVLARQVTYDKIVRSLVQVRSSRAIPAGASVQVDGKKVGEVTSSATSPALGSISLAVLRKPFDTSGISVGLASGENHAPGVVH